VRKLAVEAADNGLLAPELASGIARIKGVRSHGVRVGNWLSLQQAQRLLNTPDIRTRKGLRDRAMFATLLGCGLRRSELANLTMNLVRTRPCFPTRSTIIAAASATSGVQPESKL
jgi:integrase